MRGKPACVMGNGVSLGRVLNWLKAVVSAGTGRISEVAETVPVWHRHSGMVEQESGGRRTWHAARQHMPHNMEGWSYPQAGMRAAGGKRAPVGKAKRNVTRTSATMPAARTSGAGAAGGVTPCARVRMYTSINRFFGKGEAFVAHLQAVGGPQWRLKWGDATHVCHKTNNPCPTR